MNYTWSLRNTPNSLNGLIGGNETRIKWERIHGRMASSRDIAITNIVHLLGSIISTNYFVDETDTTVERSIRQNEEKYEESLSFYL